MNIEHLNYFAEVYRQKSISRAADNLYMSRPALSTAISKLEKTLGGVTLFERTSSGVIPTQAGEELFQSAQVILEEHSKIHYNMRKYIVSSDKDNIIRISISSALAVSYGDEIADKLISTFPHILFDFMEIRQSEPQNFFEEFDLSIMLVTQHTREKIASHHEEDYSIIQIGTLPMYVWISNLSPLQKYSTVTIDMRKTYPFCSLKSAYNGDNYAAYLSDVFNITNSKPNMEVKRSFVQHIEEFDYYTIDYPSKECGSFLYENVLKNRPISVKKTNLDFLVLLVCKKERHENYKIFYPLLTDILTRVCK